MSNKRINEIDIMRFIAIILMIIYHFVYDLSTYTNIKIDVNAPIWAVIGKTSAFLFIFIAGICCNFGNYTMERGLYVFSWGMAISFITYIFDKSEYIRFGILHLLGFSMFISPLLKKFNTLIMFIIAAFTAFAGWIFDNINLNIIFLLPFGITYKDFTSFDYYPIMPYVSLFIMGMIFQRYFYKDKISRFKIKSNKFIQYISSNSLTVYILHQPIILCILFAFKYKTGG